MKLYHLKRCRSLSCILLIRIYETWSHCWVPWCLLQVRYWSILDQAFSSYGPSFMKIQHLKRWPLSKLYTFDQNFMNLVTLFSTMMSSSTSITVHITPCFQYFWPFVYENSPFVTMSLSKLYTFDQNLWNLVTLLSTMMSSSSLIMVYIAPSFQ